MKRIHQAIAIGCLLGLSLTVVGCSKSEPTVVTAPTTAGGGPPAGGDSAGGGKGGSPGATINTGVMPAPSGVKTGLEGGHK